MSLLTFTETFQRKPPPCFRGIILAFASVGLRCKVALEARDSRFAILRVKS